VIGNFDFVDVPPRIISKMTRDFGKALYPSVRTIENRNRKHKILIFFAHRAMSCTMRTADAIENGTTDQMQIW